MMGKKRGIMPIVWNGQQEFYEEIDLEGDNGIKCSLKLTQTYQQNMSKIGGPSWSVLGAMLLKNEVRLIVPRCSPLIGWGQVKEDNMDAIVGCLMVCHGGLLCIIHTHGNVQHLIEKCLIFRMTKEECMEALSKHANITPVITSTGITFLSLSTLHSWGYSYHFPYAHACTHVLMDNSHAVWKELEKENKEFFEAYAQSQSKEDQMSEAETSEMIQKMISDHEQSKDPKV
ncbi:unnamed protein product [Ilex paraguariensis]|uniref:Uncharacterized protein n=1 Tax=Ilex paraguariensis TaxID=185542 RepID=A0ABC8V2A1_9AQUA